MIRAALALALAVGLGACARPAPRDPALVDAGLSIVIYADRNDPAIALALVSDRRWIDVPRDGWIGFDDLAGSLGAGAVVVDASAGGLVVRTCQEATADTGLDAWIGRAVTVTTTSGGAVAGVLTSAALGADPYTLTTEAGERVEVPADAVTKIDISDAPPLIGLRCRVESAHPGRQLVRLVYSTGDFRWRPRYRMRIAPGGTTVDLTTQLALDAPTVTTPRAAEVSLWAGMPDAAVPPARVWSGAVQLIDGVAIVSPATSRPASAGWVYRGAVPVTDAETPRYESHTLVWNEVAMEPAATDVVGPVEIELGDGRAIRATLHPVDSTVTSDGAAAPADRRVRIPLASSAELFGYRQWTELARDGERVIEQVLYSVANHGTTPVTVRIEEPLRPGGTVTVRASAPPDQGAVDGDRWSRQVTVPPDGIVRGAVVLQYQTRR